MSLMAQIKLIEKINYSNYFSGFALAEYCKFKLLTGDKDLEI